MAVIGKGPIFLDITGVVEVQTELNRKIAEIGGRRSQAAMEGAGLIVLGEARVLTPVDTGNLINSSYTESFQNGKGEWGVEIGYTAEYAVAVHETNRAYRKPGSQWKYLETALYTKAREVLVFIQAKLALDAA
jgi:hypothetical protein